MKPTHRAGFSLLEVLVATSILLGCTIVLAELAAIGRQHAGSAEDLAIAQLICQTRLNELLARAFPLKPVQDEPLEDRPGWVYSVEIDPLEQPGLAALRVTVSREVPEEQDSPRAKQFTLVRWIRDPYRRGNSDSTPDG